MSIKNIMFFLIGIYLTNKILEFVLKKSEKIREKSERRISMPALNSLSLYSYQDFKKVVKEYLIENYFEIIDEENELILITKDKKEYLVYCKQVKEFTDKVDKEDFYIFISELKSRNIKNGIVLTNGELEENIKFKINYGIKEIDIEYLEGNEFVKKLRKLKEEKLYKGGV